MSNVCIFGYTFSFIQINAIGVTADPELRNKMAPSKRKCYFSDEYTLDIYSDYSYANCVDECKIKAAYNVYDCLPWDKPSIYNAYI
jgi:hypothetical protein